MTWQTLADRAAQRVEELEHELEAEQERSKELANAVLDALAHFPPPANDEPDWIFDVYTALDEAKETALHVVPEDDTKEDKTS